MKVKSYLVFFCSSLVLNALQIQPIGQFEKPIEIRSLTHLKVLACCNANEVKKITANPFPIKNINEAFTFLYLCPNWSTWSVFSDEEFYEGNFNWLQYSSFIKKINFKIPIIIWQPLEKTEKPLLTFEIPIFEGLQFDDRATIEIPKDIKVHTQQLAFLNEKNLFYIGTLLDNIEQYIIHDGCLGK